MTECVIGGVDGGYQDLGYHRSRTLFWCVGLFKTQYICGGHYVTLNFAQPP